MEVLICNDDDIATVRSSFAKEAQAVKSDVEILKAWIKQQQHLPQKSDDELLERVLLRNKFRVEKAKEKLENYYTLRGLYREFFQPCNADIIPSKQATVMLPSARLTPSKERVYFIKMRDVDPENFSYSQLVKFFSLILEILLRKDYSRGDIILLDLNEAVLEHLKKVTVVEVAKAYDLYSRGYSGRLLGFHVINPPAYVNILITVLKLAFPDKLYQRVKVHNDLESVYKYVPKECLPSDFGGDLESIQQIKEKWDQVFIEYRQFFDDSYNNVADESLRIGRVPEREIFGVDGTFRRLNLD